MRLLKVCEYNHCMYLGRIKIGTASSARVARVAPSQSVQHDSMKCHFIMVIILVIMSR